MGVKGLTRHIRVKAPELGTTIELPSKSKTKIPWIVDGLGESD